MAINAWGPDEMKKAHMHIYSILGKLFDASLSSGNPGDATNYELAMQCIEKADLRICFGSEPYKQSDFELSDDNKTIFKTPQEAVMQGLRMMVHSINETKKSGNSDKNLDALIKLYAGAYSCIKKINNL